LSLGFEVLALLLLWYCAIGWQSWQEKFSISCPAFDSIPIEFLVGIAV
jgi:hypothetical protein